MIAMKGKKKTAMIKEKDKSRTRYCIKKHNLVFIGISLLAGRIIGNEILRVKKIKKQYLRDMTLDIIDECFMKRAEI